MPISSAEVGPVAITGATGFLGSHLADAALGVGLPVVAAVRTPARAVSLAARGVTVAAADLADRDALTAAFAGCSAVIANAALAAGWTPQAPEAFQAANVIGTENTLRAAHAAGVRRVIYISSVAIYRSALTTLRDEDFPQRDPADTRFELMQLVTNPHYARTKAAAEHAAWRIADELGLQLTTLRPGPIYGSRDPKLTARYAQWMTRRVLPVPTLALPHVHAGDVAEAALRALERPASIGRAYNVTGESVGIYELLRAWRRQTGAGPWLLPIPVPVRVAFDNRRVQSELGLRFRSLEDGLQEVINAAVTP